MDIEVTETSRQAQRKAVMAVLAHSDTAEISARLVAIELPDHENLREPENGLVMVRGRIGGDGAAFNLGEATVSRAAVRLSTGEIGFGYTLGRDAAKARMIALCDGQQFGSFEIEYSSVDLKKFNPVVDRLVSSLKATNGSGSC